MAEFIAQKTSGWNRTVEHLDDSVLHVDFALVALAEDFQLLQHLRALQHYIATAVEYRLCGPRTKSGAEASLGAACSCTDGSRMQVVGGCGSFWSKESGLRRGTFRRDSTLARRMSLRHWLLMRYLH